MCVLTICTGTYGKPCKIYGNRPGTVYFKEAGRENGGNYYF